jgi:hypothetical protein
MDLSRACLPTLLHALAGRAALIGYLPYHAFGLISRPTELLGRFVLEVGNLIGTQTAERTLGKWRASRQGRMTIRTAQRWRE